jgi:hypothetical protein
MTGFDIILINNFYAYPAFRKWNSLTGLSRSLRPGRLGWVMVLQLVNSVVFWYNILRRHN